ncbi:hypothetical protein [Nonomuraea rhizosphaerae]|nr:hypothetical protein [Nonomuraea rhizosphaerae]
MLIGYAALMSRRALIGRAVLMFGRAVLMCRRVLTGRAVPIR